MKFLSVLIVVLGELGIGSAFFVCIQQTNEIRKSFFSFQSGLAAACFLLMSLITAEHGFFRSAYFPSAVFAGLAARHFSLERPRWGKIMLLTSALLGTFFLMRQLWIGHPETESRWMALSNVAAGTFLFGWANGAMILGHWYLIMRGLSFGHFQRATRQLLGAIGVRTLVLGIACGWIFFRNPMPYERPNIAVSDPLFFSMRILWGILLPGIFGFMAWRCARIGSNQAGTGLLYIAEVAVLIGEILAGFLGL